ncbi:MAG TPA: cation diffusion facilitator family transporter [Bacteroidales bacterium]|nr:cation diffusion facilitator family transporter [Bacteroidales bacterium]HQG36497.1 cation diffusion facilitator family transporter [Bacteroidales bacterium]HQG52576.1 cation diffusion facilitator family transporter [Bacteroidales bacterium]
MEQQVPSNKAIKVKVARLSVASNTFLITMKLIAGLLSGSVSIISEAIHSSMDLIAAIIAFFSVRVSDNPPDSRHPYGHGKVENISGVIEAILIFIAAGWIIYEAMQRITSGSPELEMIWVGLLVMVVSGLVNTFVSLQLYRTARKTGSIALEADALHLKTDVYTSLGVAAGLGLIIITDIKWIDSVTAIAVALLILWESFQLLKKAFSPLLDVSWPEKDIAELKKILDNLGVHYHELRTRAAGNYLFVDLHVLIPKEESVENSHNYCDMIEENLKKNFKNLNVTIHVEPV